MLRHLSELDAAHLEAFECRDFRAPHTVIVEDMVRALPSAMAADAALRVAGWWDQHRLAGVVAWRYQVVGKDLICFCPLLAVRTGHRRRGIGGRLKGLVVDDARREGSVAVESQVHWDNDLMIGINIKYWDASVLRIPGDQDYCRCVITL